MIFGRPTAGEQGGGPFRPLASIHRHATVLVIDDDAATRDMVHRTLERDGFAVLQADSGTRGIRMIFEHRPDLIVLDLRMPGVDGWDTLEHIRDMSAALPVLTLSGLNTVADRVRALRAGADDFLAKPFLPAELVARVTALLRRSRLGSGEHPEELLEFGRLAIDTAARRVTVDGSPVALSPREFRLLLLLARRPGTVVTHDELIAQLWGHVAGVDSTGALSVLVSRLRRRLGEGSASGRSSIETVRGFGYRLAAGG